MSDAIPTRRGPFPADPAVTFRTHQHVAERTGDGMAPVFALRHRKDDETPVGNDGLTDDERADLAEHYRRTIMAPLSPAEKAAIKDWRESKRAARDDETPASDMGEQADVPTLIRAHQDTALALVQQATLDGLAGARETRAQENSLLALADAHAKEEGFTSGQRAGFAEGLHAAQQIVEEFKAKLDDDPYADDTRGALDDVVVALLERAVRS
jgi:hypothetical protein